MCGAKTLAYTRSMETRTASDDARSPGVRAPFLWSIGTTSLAAVLALSWIGRPTDSIEYPVVSGAYNALNHWGDSRAYPARDIPRGAWMRGYEHSRATLREPTGPAPALSIQGSGWQPIGPTNGGGRTLGLTFEPGNPNTIWAGSASGGLWRSTTGGLGATAWQRIDTGLPVLGVSTIAFDPGNADVIYIGTGEVYNHMMAGNLEADRRTRGSYGIGILRSTDGGATWSKSLDWSYEQQRGVWAIRVDPSNPATVWAATTEGIYKSTDSGASWTQKLGVIMGTDLVVHPTNTDTVLVACGNLGSAGRGIYRTTDGGDNWSLISGGGLPPNFLGKVQFAVTPADPNVVYASIGNGFEVFGPDNFTWLFRSSDFGATFNLRNTTDYSRWQGWFAHDVAVSPTNPDLVVCVGIDVWRSTDGGLTLNQVSNWFTGFSGILPDGGPEGPPDYSHADHHDVVFHPTNQNIVYFANDGGVFRSTDAAQTFAGVNGGYQSTQFYNGSVNDPNDPNLAMGGLQDNSSAIYRGPGQWQRGVLGGDGGWAAIDSTDPDIVYATAQFLFVGRSTDGGVNFSVVSPPDLGGPVAFIAPLVMSQQDPLCLYGGSDHLFKTFNGGGSWFVGQQGNPIDGNPILVMAVAPENDDVLYLATAPVVGRGSVQRTTDGGSNFTDVTGSLPDRFPGDLAVDPTDEATVYLALSGFGSSHVFRSTDYGATWVDIDGGKLPDVPTSAIAIDPLFPHHVYVGNDLGVYFTKNGGASWLQLQKGLSEAVLVNELSISVANRRLRAFTHGRGVFERKLIGKPGIVTPLPIQGATKVLPTQTPP